MGSLSVQNRVCWLAAGASCGAAGWALLCRLRAKRAQRAASRLVGKDFRGQPSTYFRSGSEGAVGLLAYDVCAPLSEEEYDRWLFGEHYHDLMANPHLEKIVLHTVSKEKKARLSSGASVENAVDFFRLAELHFRDYAAYDSYVEWFQANVIPTERGPTGKSAFRFYHLAASETISRSGGPASASSSPTTGRPGPAAAASAAAGSRPLAMSETMTSTWSWASGSGEGQKARPTVMVIGSSGNIGKEVVRQLRETDAVVLEASRNGKVKLDIGRLDSVARLDAKLLGRDVDHVVICCGASAFGPLESFDQSKWEANCMGKMVAVGRLVTMLANGEEVRCLREGGSITVTTGQAGQTVNRMWPGLAANNAGLEAFVRCSGVDAPRGVRINSVSPALVRETAEKAGLPLEGTVPAAEAAAKYLDLIFSDVTGQVVTAGSQTVFKTSHQSNA